MSSPVEALELELLPGARELLELHARELPQRDDLCGAFCGALALNAAGIRERGGSGPLDQDAVAIAAGSIISVYGQRERSLLPYEETGRRDYRLSIPTIEDSELSGTTAAGVVRGVDELGEGTVGAIPFSGPWTSHTLDGLFGTLTSLTKNVSLIANFATHHLWGSRASVVQLLAYLLDGELDAGPPPDWDVGHFACVVGRACGPGGNLYGVADTYPALGNKGLHMQPRERLAAAIDRRDKPAGGMIVVVHTEDAGAVRAGASAIGLIEGLWDNGTVTQAEI